MTTNDPSAVARSLYLEGRAAEAEGLFRRILHEQPDDFGALEGLGVLVVQQGRFEEAVSLFRRGATVQPDAARLRSNLGEALRLLGRLDEALEQLRRATELDPKLAQAWNSLGLLAQGRGHYQYAETAYREGLRLQPSSAPMYINLTNTLLARGRMAEAAEALREALRIQPNHAVALMNLGRILAEMRKPELLDEAESLCRRAVELMPSLPYTLNNLGHVLRIRGRKEEARACFEQARLLTASQETPPVRPAPTPRPQAASEDGRPIDDGSLEPTAGRLQALDAAGPVGPDSSEATSAENDHARGLLAWKYGRLDEAEACFRDALRADPTSADSWLRLARIQQERGEFELACRSARSALAIRPKLADAYRMLAFILGSRLPDDDARAMQALLEDPEVSTDERALLRFGLAAALDRRGLFAEAAAHVDAANALQAASKGMRGLAFDPDLIRAFVEKNIATFTPAFLDRRRGWGDPDPRPVFIVGLPRSGTTLTEQVLASHPMVFGAGELRDVSRIFRALPEFAGQPGGDPFEALDRLTAESARVAARDYIEQLDALAPPGAARIVDKQPDNINHLGMIALLWPGARVIRCHRDLRDVAVSCWQMGFVATSWSNDWEHIARHFRSYQRILRHWRETQPLEWLDVSYEELVGDLEGQARRMIEHLGLEWDASCLEFHTNPRIVRTPSLVQVRQPVHTQSVGRWRNYEPYIQPMFRAFERHEIRTDTPD